MQSLPVRVTLTWNAPARQSRVYVGQTFTGIAGQGGLRAARTKARDLIRLSDGIAELDVHPATPYQFVVETVNFLQAEAATEINFVASWK